VSNGIWIDGHYSKLRKSPTRNPLGGFSAIRPHV
jgi:hypothetical protein